MKSINLKLSFVLLLLIGITSCDKGKDCECTSTFSDGRSDVVNTYESLNKTSDPDCSGYVGTSTDSDGVITTTTCEAVES